MLEVIENIKSPLLEVRKMRKINTINTIPPIPKLLILSLFHQLLLPIFLFAQSANHKQAKEITAQEINQIILKGEEEKLEGNSYYIIGRFEGTLGAEGEMIAIKGFPISIRIRPIARDFVLNLEVGTKIICYGYFKTKGKLEFYAHNVEKAPSDMEIYKKKLDVLLKENPQDLEEWQKLGEWALEKAAENSDKKLLAEAKKCFRKIITIPLRVLDSNNPKHTKYFLSLIEKCYNLNHIVQKVVGPNESVFNLKEMQTLAKSILQYYPPKTKEHKKLLKLPKLKSILLPLHFIYYKNKFVEYESFKKAEGFQLYTGKYPEYSGKWVKPEELILLNHAEDRRETLKIPRIAEQAYYEKLVKKKQLEVGLSRKEVIQILGYPQNVFRLRLRKEGLLQTTNFDIWLYGKLKEEKYICFEDNYAFYIALGLSKE
ncbi:MAG: hypothetical protein D6805_09580 [Planctomycetota bacterium]|nr:MAG: hypothetical protein D6805_09580 [Planctomycetota bacterium]